MSQVQQVREHLLTGKPITSIEAIEWWGCTRLAARVCDLKEIYGEASVLSERKTEKGKTFAVYHGVRPLLKRKRPGRT